MSRVVGVDLSIRATGIGVITQRVDRPPIVSAAEFKTVLVKSGPGRGKVHSTETLRDRVCRSRAIAADVCHQALLADLVVLEGLFTGPNAGKLLDRASTWMRIADRCIAADVPVAVVAPSALKLAITGSGRSDKAAMASALARLWPDLVIGSDNEVDAVACAHLGAVALGWPVVTLARHRDVKWTEWPAFLEQAVAS